MMLERHFTSGLRYGELYRSQMFGRLMAAAFTMGGEKACTAKLSGNDDHRIGGELALSSPDQQWISDPYCYRKAAEEVMRALARYRPPGEVEGPASHLVSDSERDEWFGSLLSFFERHAELPAMPASTVPVVPATAAIARRVDLENRARRLRRDKERLERDMERLERERALMDREEPGDWAGNFGYIDVPADLMRDDEQFAIEVSGDAMAEAGILDGDTVIMVRTDIAPDGTIVAALIDQREVVLRRYSRDGDWAVLEAAHHGYETRRVESERVVIMGRLVGMMRQFDESSQRAAFPRLA
ncbi:MAG: hypothetical protein GEU87_17920 [Alphaproteobacteria bacterium]|nr:hypothetical protein [Alphaproteobacteria bacterium]